MKTGRMKDVIYAKQKNLIMFNFKTTELMNNNLANNSCIVTLWPVYTVGTTEESELDQKVEFMSLNIVTAQSIRESECW